MIKNISPRLSVITVVYNGIDKIEKTINSVLNQTYQQIEYIIIDGSSTDGTIEVIKKYADKITYWISEPDKGIYDAMNKGIVKCTGDWIHFRNCGDYFHQNDTIESVFSITIDSSVDIIYGDCRVFDSFGYCDKKPAILSKSHKEAMPVFHPSSFIRTTLHKKKLFNTKFKLSADYNFFFQCLELGAVFEYRPIIIALFDIGDGASVRNRKCGLEENFKLRGLGDSLKAKIAFNFEIALLNLHKWLKVITPDYLIKKKQIRNRKREGWVFVDVNQ